MRSLSFLATVLLSLVSVAAQSADFKRFTDYKCNGETVTVTYCRNDPGQGQPVHPLDNMCGVEYPDRPRRIPTIAPFELIVHAELAKKLATCTKPPSSDAGVAKAQAAKVDTVVFGIELGEPFSIPACPMFQIGGAGGKTCYSAMVDDIGSIARDLGGADAIPANLKTVYIAAKECPSWVSECTLHVQSIGGKVGYIGVFTKGPGVDREVRGVLAEKYGQWTLSRGVTVTPNDTAKQQIKIMELFWNLPGLYIHYQPIWANEEGVGGDIREGLIRIETETARKAKAAAPKRPKPKM